MISSSCGISISSETVRLACCGSNGRSSRSPSHESSNTEAWRCLLLAPATTEHMVSTGMRGPRRRINQSLQRFACIEKILAWLHGWAKFCAIRRRVSRKLRDLQTHRSAVGYCFYCYQDTVRALTRGELSCSGAAAAQSWVASWILRRVLLARIFATSHTACRCSQRATYLLGVDGASRRAELAIQVTNRLSVWRAAWSIHPRRVFVARLLHPLIGAHRSATRAVRVDTSRSLRRACQRE